MKPTIDSSAVSNNKLPQSAPADLKAKESGFVFGGRTSLRVKLPLAFILLTGSALLITTFIGLQIFQNSLVTTLEERLGTERSLRVKSTQDYLIWTRNMAVDLAASMESSNYSQEAMLNIIETTLSKNDQAFGSTIAFEPFQFDPNLYYWAPYYSRAQFGRLAFTQLGNPTYNYFKSDWYTLPKAQNAPVLSPPYYDAGGGEIWMVTWSVPFYSNAGIFKGVATADIAFSQTQDFVRQIVIGKKGYAFLIDRKGVVLGIGENGGTFKPMVDSIFAPPTLQQAGNWNAFVQKMTSGESGFEEIIDPQGRSVYVSYEPIGLDTGWSLGLVYPREELFLPVTRLGYTLFIATILILFVFSGILFLYSQSITQPLQRLALYANQITQVQTPLALKESLEPININTGDEIEELGNAFNQMTGDLARSFETLGNRVEARTAELTIANRLNQRRASQFEAIAQVSRVINQVQGLQDLLPQIAQLISKYFGFYHVGIFLLDTRKEYAILVAANSEGGQRMLDREHKLRIGQTGIVGTVAGSGVPRIALDTGADATYFNNPDLPETRSEMALPLFRAAAQITGVLDVQSREANAFTSEDIEILSTLAEQVSLAIVNASLYEQSQKAVIEAEMTYRRDLRSGWRKFNRAQKLYGIRRQGTKTSLLTEPGDISISYENIYQTQGDRRDPSSQITIPMKLRGEVVGMLNIKSEEIREWSRDELDIITAIIERAALSIENARLISESRKIAEKERMIGEISTKVSSFTNRENILQAAVVEIGRAMPGAEISIQIQGKDNKGE